MKLDGFTLVTGIVALGLSGFAGYQALSTPPERPDVEPVQAEVQSVDSQAVATVLERMVAPQRAEPQPVERPDPLRDLRLIGVMDTDQGRVAVLDDEGQMRTLREGQSTGGIEMIAIDSSLVVIALNGEEHRLSLGE